MATSANKTDSIFWAALDIPSPAERAVYLQQACGGDVRLRASIEELLAAYPKVDQFLERPAAPIDISFEPTERPGMEIGSYKLLEQIGEGGMGTVFMAQQVTPVKRKVALKVIKPGMDTKQVIARFEAERQALSLMDHPNIARVLDAGETESGRPYFVMELVRGVSITDYCQAQQLDTRGRLNLFAAVCRAAHHAHQKGIIHRDLKPNNVLITSHDGVPVVKVIDFGVAKALNQELTEQTLFTQFAQMIGTPLYMSPEQAELSGLDIDTRSDIYSLGVLLYELLTGTTPFDKDMLAKAGFDEMRRIICEVEPETVSARIAKTLKADSPRRASFNPKSTIQNPKSFAELDWIAVKALEKDRNRRYESATALAADIERYLRDEPVLACPPSALYRFRKFARRNNRVLATMAILAVALVVSVGALAFGYVQASRRQQQTQTALEREQQTLSRERQAFYFNRIGFADSSYWLAKDVGQAQRLLDECPPEFRHWEWHYLKRLCQSGALTIRLGGTIHSIAASAEGQRLAIGRRNAISICDSHTGRQLLTLRGHTGIIAGLAFGPDGRQLASAAEDQTVKLWDATNGEEIRTLRGHQGAVHCVAFGPVGAPLVSGGQDQTVKVWDATAGALLLSLQGHSGPVRGVALSRDGQRLASASDDKTVRIWNAKTGQELAVLHGQKTAPTCVAFDLTGNLNKTSCGS